MPQWLDYTFLGLGLASSAAISACVIVAAPHFAQVFSSFGAEISPLSRFFVKFYLLFAILPVLVLATWRYWPYKAFRSLVAAGFGIASSLMLLALFTWAMYDPIFRLSDTP
jgi:hypothetical protein